MQRFRGRTGEFVATLPVLCRSPYRKVASVPRNASSFSLDRLLADIAAADGGTSRPRRDTRPAWLSELTDCIAELFEPLRETARVGYDCRPEAGRWLLDVFVGPSEQVGGADDGRQAVPSFRFDLRSLFRCFDRVDDCQWLAAPAGEAANGDQPALPAGFSQLQVDGLVQGEPCVVTVSSLPPAEIGVGLKIFGDGEPVLV